MFAIKNAVLYKKMSIDMKKPGLLILLCVLNVLMGIVSTLVVFGIAMMASNYSAVDPAVMLGYFTVFIAAESMLVAFVIPALTASSISGEREKQTLEVLLTTKMTTWEIIKGKYLASILSVMLILVTSMPFLALEFIYGGVSLLQIFEVMLVIIVCSMYTASFGILFSTLSKKTLVSTVLSYMFMIFLIMGTLTLVFSLCAGIAIANEAIYEFTNTSNSSLLPVELPVYLLFINPAVTVYDTLVHIVGLDFDFLDIGGMNVIVSGLSDGMITQDFFLIKYWSVFSMLIMSGITYLVLRWAAYMLNPTHANKSNMKKNAVRIKNIEAQKAKSRARAEAAKQAEKDRQEELAKRMNAIQEAEAASFAKNAEPAAPVVAGAEAAPEEFAPSAEATPEEFAPSAETTPEETAPVAEAVPEENVAMDTPIE